jgi:uncharacterized heparinase superfamily protein
VLVLRYVAHHALTRRHQRSLRTTYDTVVAQPGTAALLRPTIIDLPAARALPESLRWAAGSIRAEAELIVDHRVDLLGSGLVDLGENIEWSRDFKSGYSWPPVFYQDLEVTRLTDASDAKVPWELSRSHHLLTLARAAALFEEERYAQELERQLGSWLAANPTGYGINWANPMEVALRAVNWVWAVGTLEAWRPLDATLRAELTRSLQTHGRHIAANLEGTPYLRSNHYLSDLLGLLVLGSVLERDPEAEEWRRFARSEFEEQIQSQVHDDGTGFEASLPYHGFALEILLIAAVVASRTESPMTSRFTQRLRQMLEASRLLRHPDGRFPQFGDSDSGRVLPVSFARPPTVDHLLWLGAALFMDFRPLPGDPHAEVALTLGLPTWHRLLSLPPADSPTSAAFPAGGYYALRGRETYVVVRCGGVGQNGNGGHAHNDLLSFELSRQVPIVVDSGTYVYTSYPDERNAFRGTAAHNTVVVAGEEINPLVPNELFRLRGSARPQLELWDERPDWVRMVASHDGYTRLRPPTVHRRTFLLERSSGRLAVRDELVGEGEQTAETFLHLAPSTLVTRIGAFEFHIENRGTVATLAYTGTSEVEVVNGWVSNQFGRRQRATVLVARAAGFLPLKFGYEFCPS